jgi:hypothetical protein
MSKSKNQHVLDVSLLKQLGLDYIRLEPQRNGQYWYVARNFPLGRWQRFAAHCAF